MPHPGHFICASDCRFRLNTYVNGYIVSTVGEMFPDAPVREILAKCKKITLRGQGDERKYDYMKKVGYEEVGFGRKYETMVFKAVKSEEKCCPWKIDVETELECDGYNDPESATLGHYKRCKEYDKKK